MSTTAAQPPINTKAATWTILVHAVLLLLFFFITYQPPQFEPVEELGMEVNLGTAADGYGTEQPMDVEDPAPDEANPSGMSSAAEATLAASIENDEPDAPVVATAKEKKATTPPTVTKHNNTNNKRNDRPANNATNTPKPKARYVYGGSTGKGGNSAATNAQGSNEGNTKGNGDRGVPGGTPGASNYEGTPGSGNGINYNLSGRNIVAYPEKDAEFKEGGKVTVRITVNREGIIVNKSIQSSSNTQLSNIALRKINSIRFNKSEASPEEQFGTITFVFKTRS